MPTARSQAARTRPGGPGPPVDLRLRLIGPLAVNLIKKDTSPFTRHHAAEALTFHITLAIAAAVSFVLLLPAVAIGGAVFGVLAAVAAGRGEYYRYPLTIRFVS